MSIISDEIRFCRVPARCNQCAGAIEKGSEYRCVVYVDGDLRTYKAHVDCDAASDYYRNIAGLFPDEHVFVWDFIPEDSLWLWAEFPTVARRINMPSLSWAHDRYLSK